MHEPGGGRDRRRVGDLRVAMLHYAVGTESVMVNVIDQDGDVRSQRLTSVERIADRADRLARMLRAPTRFPPAELTKALREFSQDWGRWLLPDVDGYDVLVVVPHHALHDLPLQVVRTGAGDECVANRFGLSFCSSATLFERAVARNPVRGDGTKDWTFPDGDGAPEAPRRCAAMGVDVLTGDPRYAELALDCARRFPEHHVAGSRDALKLPPVRDADVVCLVCHGVTSTAEHDDSGLLLVGSPFMRSELQVSLHLGQSFWFRDLPFRYFPPQLETAPEVGPPELMTIGEVRTFVRTSAQLVMLLGCSTATGQLRSGDSYASLAYQWLQAGAVGVLGHQWEADFPFVAGWVPMFLDHWARRRVPKALAMRAALNQALDEGLTDRDALHIWGAVTLLGDWL